MRQVTTVKTMVKQLNEKYGSFGLNAQDAVGFKADDDNKPGEAIWLKGAYDVGINFFDRQWAKYEAGDEKALSVPNPVQFTPWEDLDSEQGEMIKFLEKRGWYVEPWDGATWLAYKQ